MHFFHAVNGPFKLGDVYKMRFAVSAKVRIQIVFFWAVTSCAQVGGYEHFEGTCCLHAQSFTTATLLWPANRNYHLIFVIERGKAAPGGAQKVPEG